MNRIYGALMLVLGGSLIPAANAIERGVVPGGRYATGGIGQDEIAQLDSERSGYALWIVTAAKGSGAYLSDARVTISDAQHRRVFDRVLAGPWLLVDLPPGKYVVDVAFEGLSQQKAIAIGKGDAARQLVFHFDVPDAEWPARPRQD